MTRTARGKRIPRIAAVVLAAGTSTRMGVPKPLLPFRGRLLLAHALDAVRRSSVATTVVVLGAAADRVRAAVPMQGVEVVQNPAYARGLSTSLQAGVAAVPRADGFLFVLGDQPFVLTRTIDALVRSWEPDGSKILIPTFRGRRGNPVLVDRTLARTVETLRGDEGFRAIFPDHAGDIREIPVADPGILVDLDTPEQVEALEKMLASGRPVRAVLEEWVERAGDPRT